MGQIVWRIFYDHEKEERFLNDMSKRGLALTKYRWGRYMFQDAPKGEYIYRLELLEYPVNHPESKKYIEFMEDTGAEFVTSFNGWAYFRKKASEGKFDIFTDVESRLKHYKRIMNVIFIVTLINLALGVLNLSMGYLNISSGINKINLYVSIFSLSVGSILLLFFLLPLRKKVLHLEKEKAIRE